MSHSPLVPALPTFSDHSQSFLAFFFFFLLLTAIYCIIPIILQVLGCCEFCRATNSTQSLHSRPSSATDETAANRVHVPRESFWRRHRLAENRHNQLPATVRHDQVKEFGKFSDRMVQSWRNRFSRAKPIDRRLFFSFNQMLLSMIAPRLMRYQFDLMMHSVVAELFRKVLVPAAGFSGDSNSLLSSLGSLLRGRQSVPRTTTAAPQQTVDVQRLLDNAHKLIALQSLMRKPVDRPSGHFPANNGPLLSTGAQDELANGSVNHEPKRQHPPQSGGRGQVVSDTKIDRSTSQLGSQSKANNDPPVQLAISTKDILSFLQNNLKQQLQPGANYNLTSLSTAKNTAFQQEETSSNMNNLMHSTSLAHSQPGLPMDETSKPAGAVDSFLDASTKKSPFVPRQRARFEDFKMSHLTFIDTEVPNYGNQLLVREQGDSLIQREVDSSPEIIDPARSQLGFIDPSLLSEKDVHNLKNDDLERANRWNDVLVNMNEAQKKS